MPCPAATSYTPSVDGLRYTCTFPTDDPSKKTCSQLCSCDSDCSKATGCCTPLSTPDGDIPVKICVTGGHNAWAWTHVLARVLRYRWLWIGRRSDHL